MVAAEDHALDAFASQMNSGLLGNMSSTLVRYVLAYTLTEVVDADPGALGVRRRSE